MRLRANDFMAYEENQNTYVYVRVNSETRTGKLSINSRRFIWHSFSWWGQHNNRRVSLRKRKLFWHTEKTNIHMYTLESKFGDNNWQGVHKWSQVDLAFFLLIKAKQKLEVEFAWEKNFLKYDERQHTNLYVVVNLETRIGEASMNGHKSICNSFSRTIQHKYRRGARLRVRLVDMQIPKKWNVYVRFN